MSSLKEAVYAPSVNVYPNPSNGLIHIQSETAVLENIVLYSVTGTKLAEYRQLNRHTFLIDHSFSGILLVHIQTANGSLVAKVLSD